MKQKKIILVLANIALFLACSTNTDVGENNTEPAARRTTSDPTHTSPSHATVQNDVSTNLGSPKTSTLTDTTSATPTTAPATTPATAPSTAPTTTPATAPTSASSATNPSGTDTAQNSNPILNIVVENIREIQGKICFSIFNNEHASAFGHEDAAATDAAFAACETVTGNKIAVQVKSLHTGAYAIALFHDKNDNGILDKMGALGIPTEGFGFSKNPPLRIGAPDFASCQFFVPETGDTETITLKYLL